MGNSNVTKMMLSGEVVVDQEQVMLGNTNVTRCNFVWGGGSRVPGLMQITSNVRQF